MGAICRMLTIGGMMDYYDEEMSYEEIKDFLDKHNIKAKVLDPDWAEFFNATCERYRKND